jgi:hypothetical protein
MEDDIPDPLRLACKLGEEEAVGLIKNTKIAYKPDRPTN